MYPSPLRRTPSQTPSARWRTGAGTSRSSLGDRTLLIADIPDPGTSLWGSWEDLFDGDNALTLRQALLVLEFLADDLEERTCDPRPPPSPLPPHRDEVERCMQAEIELSLESYRYRILADDTILQIGRDLWVDECSCILSRAVHDRPLASSTAS